MTNISMVIEILSKLRAAGVDHFVVCAGARNAPIVEVLTRAQDLKVFSFFEERSAAFFAMGCSRRLGSPVAVVTTSGTAAAELLPAVIESYHSGIPLVAITADRPERLRGTGAPQSMDQIGLFAKFCEFEFDLSLKNTKFDLKSWQKLKPIHFNIAFDEPLIDSAIPDTVELRC